MEDKTNKKYDILMIIWGLLLGPIESLFIFSSLIEKIDISFIKVPYVKLYSSWQLYLYALE